jgi:hypothetical protein
MNRAAVGWTVAVAVLLAGAWFGSRRVVAEYRSGLSSELQRYLQSFQVDEPCRLDLWSAGFECSGIAFFHKDLPVSWKAERLKIAYRFTYWPPRWELKSIEWVKPRIEIRLPFRNPFPDTKSDVSPCRHPFSVDGGDIILRRETKVRPVVEYTVHDAQAVISCQEGAPMIHGHGVLSGADVFFVLGQSSGEWRLTLSWKNETVMVEGTVERAAAGLRFNGSVDIRGLDIARYFPRSPVQGRLNASLDGGFDGLLPAEWLSGAGMEGGMDIRSGRFLSVRLLKDLVHGVAATPEGRPLLEATPPWLQELLEPEATPFELAQADVQILEGQARFDRILIKHPLFLVDGGFRTDTIAGQTEGRGSLAFLEVPSRSLLEIAPGLSYLISSRGRMVFPFALKGLMNRPTADLDFEYMAVRSHQATDVPEPEAQTV